MATVVVMLSKLLTHGTLLSRSFGKGLNHSNKLVMKPLECLHKAKSQTMEKKVEKMLSLLVKLKVTRLEKISGVISFFVQKIFQTCFNDLVNYFASVVCNFAPAKIILSSVGFSICAEHRQILIRRPFLKVDNIKGGLQAEKKLRN